MKLGAVSFGHYFFIAEKPLFGACFGYAHHPPSMENKEHWTQPGCRNPLDFRRGWEYQPGLRAPRGQQVAGKPNWTLDEYGDILTVRNLPGRQQTIRHDTYKWCISRLMGSFPHECEAMELFTASILDPAFFSQPARNRARQGVVPDFLLQPPSGRQELMDVKTVSFCPTRYPAAILDTRHAAVSRRASAVHREMHAKARKVDRRWNGTAQGAQGPVERRMQEFGPIGGLVVGAFGEASADVLTLIQRTALFNAERNGLWRCMGASSLEDGAKVLEKRAIRTLGVEGVRGLARARLANLSHVCSNYRQSGPNRGREKAYYENARQAHYERFGPRAFTTSRAADNTPPSLEGSGAGGWFPASLPKIG